MKSTPKTITATMKYQMWEAYASGFRDKYSVPCAAGCGQPITPFTYHVGHVISKERFDAEATPEQKLLGPNAISNLKPICAKCNLSMGEHNMIEFMRRHYTSLPTWASSDASPYPMLPVKPERFASFLEDGSVKYFYDVPKTLMTDIVAVLDGVDPFSYKIGPKARITYLDDGFLCTSDYSPEKAKPSPITWSVLDGLIGNDKEYIRRAHFISTHHEIPGVPRCADELSAIKANQPTLKLAEYCRVRYM